MLKSITLAVCLVSLAGCAHHGAVRVTCDGALRPVNAPIESQDPPVSVSPHDPTDAKTPERHP